MLYKAQYVDGSEELVEAANIRKARTEAQKLYDVPIKSVVVQDEVEEVDADEEAESEEEGE
jgi:hypothetical protein